MNGLTEAERNEVARLFGFVPEPEPLEQMLGAVARIKADAHAAGVAEGRALRERVEALADEWERAAPLCSDEEESVRRLLVRELRAALAGTSPQGEGERPRIVCLCGSTRFYNEFQRANYDLTMRGEIVLSVGFYPHASAEHGHGEGVGHDSAEKVALDELHKRKIDLADYVCVLDVDGYIGDSTRSEIAYAERVGKPVTYLSEGGGRAADKSEPYRVSPARSRESGSRERLDPLAATPHDYRDDATAIGDSTGWGGPVVEGELRDD